MKLCFATNNQHKIREVKSLIPSSVELLSLEDIHCDVELPETGFTLEDNSFEKADYVLKHFKIDCFADDTGLEVDILDGEPGVFSARYAGFPPDSTKNIEKLLNNLSGKEDRKARFRTIITLLLNSKKYLFEGVMEGAIINSPKGDNGFGYDPIFIPKGHTATFAEMSSEMKNSISHRAIAVQKLTDFLSNY